MGRTSLPYTAKDYESLRRELVARIPQLTDRWTDFNPTDPGMVLLELFCGVADVLFYYLDAQTAEAFLSTARQRQNLISLCKLIGYRLDCPVAATTELRFSLPAALDGDITIPARAVCRARLSDGTSIDFETTESATIPHGAVTASASTRQGNRKGEAFTARDVRGQRIRFASKSIAQGTVTVSVVDEPWTEIPHFVESAVDATHFRTETDPKGVTAVLFGDGVNGVVPTTGATIVVEYLETLGSAGNLGVNTVRELTTPVYLDGTLLQIHVTNPVAATGGADPETLDHARLHAPAELAAYLEGRKIITTEVNLFDPAYRKIAVDAEVVAYSTEDPALVRGRVETALRDFFAFERMAFGQSVYQSDLVALLDGVRGVSYVHLFAPAGDVLIRPGEIPVLGALNLDVKRGGKS